MSPVLRTLSVLRVGRGALRGPGGGPLGFAAWAIPLLVALAAGCNPAKTGAKLGVHLIGEVIEDGDVKQRGEALVGRPVSAADEIFGQTIDVFKDVRSERRWRTYPAKLDPLDPLGQQRYVVEVLANKVVTVSKCGKSSRKVDIPQAFILKEKVKGKSPQECEARLELGRPLLAVRSENTKRLVQLYDASMMTDLGTPHYCVVRFDENDRCSDLEFVAVGASTKKEPVAR
jgi:hypothetical protein